MRKAFLFSAVVTLALFVTVETPVRPEAGFHADFDAATQAEMLQVSLLTPKHSVNEIGAL